MAQGKPQLKFERNPCIKFRDNCDTDRRTTDGRTTDDGQIAILPLWQIFFCTLLANISVTTVNPINTCKNLNPIYLMVTKF